MPTGESDNASETTSSLRTLAAQDREPMPPPPPRPAQPRDGGPLDRGGLPGGYDVYHSTPPHALVDALRGRFQGLHRNRPFAMALLPHGATSVQVRQLQVLVRPVERAPTTSATCVSSGSTSTSRTRARVGPAPRLGAHAHRPTVRATACDKRRRPGTNSATAEVRHPQHPPVQWPGGVRQLNSPRKGTQPPGNGGAVCGGAAEVARGALGHGNPSVVCMVVCGTGHYYQARITPQPLERHWNLGAVHSRLPRETALPDGPTTLPPDHLQDPLTTIVSGRSGSWQPGHALYCLWQ